MTQRLADTSPRSKRGGPSRAEGEFDVVVIGAGVLGASAAFHLASRGAKVAIVESRSGFAEGSSGRSFASVRAQWADPLNIEVSWRSIQRWRDFETDHGLDVGYTPTGYLLLFPESVWEKQLEAVELQRSFGISVETLTPQEALSHTEFDPTGIAGATWCQSDGQVDPHSATGAFLNLTRGLGGQTYFGFQVEQITPADDGSWEIVSADGRSVRGQHVVNAAGGWAREIGALAGFDIPVVHSRRNIFASGDGFAQQLVPMTVDLGTGAYLRSEGARILLGGMRPGEPDGYNVTLDHDWLEGLLELAGERFPWLWEMPLDISASWAGTYENTPDNEAIVGAEPTAPTWVNACGASGHGIVQAPEIGRMVTEQILDGQITSYDASALAIDRFRGAGANSKSLGLVF